MTKLLSLTTEECSNCLLAVSDGEGLPICLYLSKMDKSANPYIGKTSSIAIRKGKHDLCPNLVIISDEEYQELIKFKEEHS